MRSRTVGAIALRPMGNATAGYFFLSLNTGRRISAQSWTPLPVPQEVIHRVHVLAQQSNASPGCDFRHRDRRTEVADITANDDFTAGVWPAENNDEASTSSSDSSDSDSNDSSYNPD